MTRNDFGIVLEDRNAIERLSDNDFRQLIFKHSWLLLRNAHFEAAEFEGMASRLGGHISYGFGKVLNMEAQKESDQSQFTNASMPLHQDAILNAENNAQFLVFRCLETTATSGGETLLTDNRQFMANMPKELSDVMRSVEFSYQPMTAGYYKAGESGDIRLAPLCQHPETGEELPHLALDDPEDERRNYASCVSGYTSQKSRELMERIDAGLRAPDVLYPLKWQVGDFLVLDNFLVCHC